MNHNQAIQHSVNKLSQFIADTGVCPHEEFGSWKDCNDAECQKLKGKQPKEKSAWCWRRWGGCPTCNKGFGAAPASAVHQNHQHHQTHPQPRHPNGMVPGIVKVT